MLLFPTFPPTIEQTRWYYREKSVEEFVFTIQFEMTNNLKFQSDKKVFKT